MLWLAVAFVLALATNQVLGEQVTPGFLEDIDNKEAWDARIVSGWKAYPGQHPHMVSLRMVNNVGTVQACGGSIVSRQWIITAAHCTAAQVSLLVRAGVTNLTRPEIFTETQEYYMYPTYNPTNPGLVQPNDIAMVKLQISLTYSQYLKPIRIQSSVDAHKDYDNLIVYASGFGRTWTNGPTTEHLLWVYLRGVSNAACTNIFTSKYVTENTVCAKFFNVTSQSICQGDSGGPLVHVSSENAHTLVGVSSFVAASPIGCHSGVPGAFIRPGAFHSWFTQISGIDFENPVDDKPTTTSTSTTTAAPTTKASTTTVTFAPSTTSTSAPSTTSSSTSAPSTTSSTSAPPTTNMTYAPSTTSSTSAPTTTRSTYAPSTTTLSPITTTSALSTTTAAPSSTTLSPSTTSLAPTTPTTPAPEEEDEDDAELEDLLKRLEVKVKVRVILSKYLKKKKQIQEKTL
ncbi:serine protease 24 [Danaus plexippus plexippus]|uniref:Serine protease 24 n=1 Tax=Danaus plexippus plexippus TaxID=278856 RepID=A0A212FMY7_DANPL|nr:serine protease 24 [Danaus plexippus plexippus]